MEGIAIFSTSHVLIDAIGVRQLGGLARELAKQTAEQATKQQDAVLAEAKRQDLRQPVQPAAAAHAATPR